ncbi:hypothetical protein KCTC52924_02760 [Arenibacter antarcticus]|uniref:YCII-related domain-containing protein n=1 Tax=Arenibacter antarcticus TaxID=2040469 RepID=A0ABW5VKG3_9FLAO|nr:hypothetical protein [Arenibacter sp. H213]MCM4167180.1 hypothetical protein [Arenibacter sp. H213]
MKKTIITRHKVGDFNTWIKGHQDRLDLFGPAMSDLKTFQDADDPNSVVMIIEVTDMEKFEAIINDPSNKDIKTKHTVLDPITVSMQINP